MRERGEERKRRKGEAIACHSLLLLPRYPWLERGALTERRERQPRCLRCRVAQQQNPAPCARTLLFLPSSSILTPAFIALLFYSAMPLLPRLVGEAKVVRRQSAAAHPPQLPLLEVNESSQTSYSHPFKLLPCGIRRLPHPKTWKSVRPPPVMKLDEWGAHSSPREGRDTNTGAPSAPS